jgi:hypothetical protein
MAPQPLLSLPLLLKQHMASSLPSSPTAASSRSTRAAPVAATKTVSSGHVAPLAARRVASFSVSAAATPRVRAFTEASVPAAAPRKKWYAPSPANKKAPAAAPEHTQQQSAVAAQAPAPSARKTWFRPPLSRSLSSLKQLQQRAQQPATEQQQQLQQQQQHMPAVAGQMRAGSRLWRRRSTGSIMSQTERDQQQQQRERLGSNPLQSFEAESAANSDSEDDDYLARVPEALQYRDACWPTGSEVSLHFLSNHHVSMRRTNVSRLLVSCEL